MTTIRFFINKYECAYAQVEIESDEFYPIPHIGEEISSISSRIIVQYKHDYLGYEEQKLIEKDNFDFFHVINVVYALGDNENDENLIDVFLEGDYYDFN